MDPRIEYAKAEDGASIACTAIGQGPAVVIAGAVSGETCPYRRVFDKRQEGRLIGVCSIHTEPPLGVRETSKVELGDVVVALCRRHLLSVRRF